MKYKTLGDMYTANSGLTILPDGNALFGIWNTKTKSFVNEERWTSRKAAKDYLAVSLMLTK